jgi:hypothetical protein
MTARDTFNEMKIDEVDACRRRLRELQALANSLEEENHRLRQQIAAKKLKSAPPQHPGQLKIEEEK